MIRFIYLLAACLLVHIPLHAQTCASPYGSGSVSYSETCSPTGAAAYNINITATSDSALAFEGLWEVPTTLIAADIDCQAHTFEIARQSLLPGFYIEGQGSLNLPNVGIEYRIYTDSVTTTPVDQCSGIYLSTAVGLGDLHQAQCVLYPNPTHGSTHLRVTATVGSDETWSYRVLDLQGREAAVGALDAGMQAIIDTQHMATGMYRVVVQSSDGQLVSKVLVVE